MALRSLVLSIILQLTGCAGVTPSPEPVDGERPWKEQYPALLAADS